MIIGAGWVKTDKNGKNYLSCSIEIIGMKFYFSLFKVDQKENEKGPDYQIVTFTEKKNNGE